MDKEVLIDVKQSYGVSRYYPANETAKNILKLISPTRKAFTPEEITLIRGLGFKVVRKVDTDTDINLTDNGKALV